MNITPTGMTKDTIDPPVIDMPGPDEELPPHTDADAPESSELDSEQPEPSPDFEFLSDDPFADEPAVAPHLQPTIQPIRVAIAVIGSAEWGARSAALEAVQDFWHQSGAQEIVLHVSGCPTGAEAVIADAAVALGWTVVGTRDEDLPRVGVSRVFAFIRDHSEGAERALEIVRAAGISTYVLREELPADRKDAWANR